MLRAAGSVVSFLSGLSVQEGVVVPRVVKKGSMHCNNAGVSQFTQEEDQAGKWGESLPQTLYLVQGNLE